MDVNWVGMFARHYSINRISRYTSTLAVGVLNVIGPQRLCLDEALSQNDVGEVLGRAGVFALIPVKHLTDALQGISSS
jgi:hypothetical protein